MLTSGFTLSIRYNLMLKIEYGDSVG